MKNLPECVTRRHDGELELTVRIRRVADGLERDYVDSWEIVDEREIQGEDLEADTIGTMEYMWSDGNYGCDCNRALFFARVAGEPDPDRVRGCSEGEYVIVAPAWLSELDEVST